MHGFELLGFHVVPLVLVSPVQCPNHCIIILVQAGKILLCLLIFDIYNGLFEDEKVVL